MRELTACNTPEMLVLAARFGGRLAELCTVCRPQKIAKGQAAFSRAHLDESWVYLISGRLSLSLLGKDKYELQGGVPETLLPFNQYRDEFLYAEALTELEILKIDHETIELIVDWRAQEERRSSEKDVLKEASSALSHGILSRLPQMRLSRLQACFVRQAAQAGDLIVCQGDPGDAYYVIEAGVCSVSRKERDGKEIWLANLTKGQAFGEEALLVEPNLRNANVRMQTDGELLRLSKADFVEHLKTLFLQRLSWGEAEERVAMGALWLDVRYRSDYENGHLPGAISIPLSQLRQYLASLDREADYLVYCQDGARSPAASFLLSQHGFHAAYLEGGILGVPA